MKGDKTWSCEQVAGTIDLVREELGSRDLIQPWAVSSGGGPALKRCDGCRGKKKKFCKGWHFAFAGTQALRFVPVRLSRGPTVTVVLTGEFDFQRSEVPRSADDWIAHPARAMTSAVELERDNGDLITRHHVDLANVDQTGPLWHLQVGGVRANTIGLKGIDVPRWPVWPADFVLMVELVLYNFFWNVWDELRTTATWRTAVQQSERLVFGHYLAQRAAYDSAGSSSASWLSAQCGIRSGWDPRPD